MTVSTAAPHTRARRDAVRWTHTSVLGRTLADAARLTLVAGVLMLAMTALIGLMWTAIGDQIAGLVSEMPPALNALIGGADMSTPVGWMDAEVGAMFAPGVVAGVAIVLVARALAGEVEGHTLDLLLSAPVERSHVVVTKLLGVWLAVVALDLLILVGYVVGAALGGFDLPAEGLAAVTVQTTLLGWFAASVAALVAVWTGERRRSIALAAGVVGASYVAASFLPQYDALAWLGRLSPWYAFNGASPLSEGFTPTHTVALLGLSVAVGVLAVWLFQRRDLPG
jgi:ABC-2 type transport system permease protein